MTRPEPRAVLFTAPHRPTLRVAARRRNGRLDDLLLEDAAAAPPRTGEIWAARFDRKAGGGGFATLGPEAPGGAYLSDAEGLAPGAALLVEILRGAEDASPVGKAALAGRRLTFRGRWLAHTPTAPGVNLSKKIDDPATRAALSAALGDLAGAGGFVVRTRAAALGPTEREAVLRAEATALAEAAAAVMAEPLTPPRRLRPAPDLATRAAAEWGDPPALIDASMDDPALLEQLDALCGARATLGGPDVDGAWLQFDRTEALIAVDVNSGGARSVAAVNHAAAAEIPRQLRLRGWGGMVLVDFAGDVARSASVAARLERALRAAADPAWRLAGWGPLGLYEATRRRDRPALARLWPGGPHGRR